MPRRTPGRILGSVFQVGLPTLKMLLRFGPHVTPVGFRPCLLTVGCVPPVMERLERIDFGHPAFTLQSTEHREVLLIVGAAILFRFECHPSPVERLIALAEPLESTGPQVGWPFERLLASIERSLAHPG